MLRVRIACGLAALACAAASWEVVRQGLAARPLALAALVGGGALAIVLAVAVFVPRRALTAAGHRLLGIQPRLAAADRSLSTAAAAGLFGIAIVACGLLIARFLLLENDPADDDQGAFLATAQAVAERGGPVQLVADLYAGRFDEANRHPLYIAFLSLVPRFEAGRVLSVTLAVITFFGMTALCARRYGAATAGCFAVLLATNAAFCRFATSVVCEVLMILLGGCLWFAWPRERKWTGSPPMFETPPKTRSASVPVPFLPRDLGSSKCPPAGNTVSVGRLCMEWALAGVLLALLWLTKASGLLLAGIGFLWIGWCIIRERFSRRSLLAAGCFAIAWCIVASPLLVRNVRRFGSPIYNVNSKLLFADEYADAVLESPHSTGELAAEYWRTHSIAQIVSRELNGLVWETYILLRSLGPPPLDDGRVLIGLALALMIVTGAASGTAARDGARVALLWCATLVVVFAWYVPVAAGERFLMPLLVPLLVLAAHGIVATVGAVADRSHAGRWLIGGAIIWCALWTAATWLWAEPL